MYNKIVLSDGWDIKLDDLNNVILIHIFEIWKKNYFNEENYALSYINHIINLNN